jgi:HlyD family secretion protein
VFVVRDGVARQRGVRPGMRTETHTQIQSGLQPGAEVVVGPDDTVQRRLSDGDAVELRSSAHLRE